METIAAKKSKNYQAYLKAQKAKASEYVSSYDDAADVEAYDPAEMLSGATFKRTPKQGKLLFELADGAVVWLSKNVTSRFENGEDITSDTAVILKKGDDGEMYLILQGTAGSGGGSTTINNPFA
jgi:hypothetical protein